MIEPATGASAPLDRRNEQQARTTSASPSIRARRRGRARRCAHAASPRGDGVREADRAARGRSDRPRHPRPEDPAVVAELVRSPSPSNICPSSNVILGVVPIAGRAPGRTPGAAGVAFSLNTDDPLLYASICRRVRPERGGVRVGPPDARSHRAAPRSTRASPTTTAGTTARELEDFLATNA